MGIYDIVQLAYPCERSRLLIIYHMEYCRKSECRPNRCAWQYFYLCLQGKTVLLSFITYATYYHEPNRLGTKLASDIYT